MNNPIRDETIEAAAKAAYGSYRHWSDPDWEGLHDLQRKVFRLMVAASIKASAPLMLADAWNEGRMSGFQDAGTAPGIHGYPTRTFLESVGERWWDALDEDTAAVIEHGLSAIEDMWTTQ